MEHGERKVKGGELKSVDVAKLPMPRLKAYRRKLKRELGSMTICDCGDWGCPQLRRENEGNRYYEFIRAENQKADLEFNRRCRAEAALKKKREWAFVPAIKQKA